MSGFLKSRLIASRELLWASLLCRNARMFEEQARKKTTLITMIRNEISILESFCMHALPLFDRIILIDHLSSDGSREYIKRLSEKYASIECYFFEEPGYYQSELMTWAVQHIAGKETPGWVFLLDADEFLPFQSRAEFDRKLAEFNRFPVICMPWLNMVPLDMESGRIKNEFFLQPPRPSPHHKIAFQPTRIPLGNYFIAQGNHALFLGTRSAQVKFPARNAFPIYHLPIRTKRQFREKILLGLESYRRMGKDRPSKNGFHWDEIHRIMAASSLTDNLMAGIAAHYGNALHPPYERSLDELRQNGYKEVRFDLCVENSMLSLSDAANRDRAEMTTETPGPAGDRRLEKNRWITFDRLTRAIQIVED